MPNSQEQRESESYYSDIQDFISKDKSNATVAFISPQSMKVLHNKVMPQERVSIDNKLIFFLRLKTEKR